jgi:hypothetical protein
MLATEHDALWEGLKGVAMSAEQHSRFCAAASESIWALTMACKILHFTLFSAFFTLCLDTNVLLPHSVECQTLRCVLFKNKLDLPTCTYNIYIRHSLL